MTGVTDSVRAAIVASRATTRETIGRWAAGPEYRALARAFDDCPQGDPEPAARRAHALLADGDWAAALLAPLVDALARDPFFEPPFRASRDRLRIGAVLFDHPAVSITACVTSAAAMRAAPPPRAMIFSGRLTVTRYVRAGGATLRCWETEPAGADFSATSAPPCTARPAIALADGDVHVVDGRREAQLLDGARSDVLTLVATIRAGPAMLMREHAVAGGELLRVASGDDRSSRIEMLLAFLRLAGRADAGARFDDATRDPAFHLRWAAMREWLALDARAALPRLAEMAATDPHAEIRAAASRTLATARSRVEQASCPA